MVRMENDENTSGSQDQIMYVQKVGRELVKPLRTEKNKNGEKKSQNLTMLGN